MRTVVALSLFTLASCSMGVTAYRVTRRPAGELMSMRDLWWILGGLLAAAVIALAGVAVAPAELLRPIAAYFIAFMITFGGLMAAAHYRSRRKEDPYE